MIPPDGPIPPELTRTDDALPDDAVDRVADAIAAHGTAGLDAATVGTLDDYDETPDEARGWRIRSDGTAEWAMGKRQQAAQRIAAAQAQAAEWRARIDAWLESVTRRDAATVAYMDAHLQRYALERRDADPRNNMTTRLPSGTVRTREQSAQAHIANPGEVIGWARRALDPKDAEAVVKEEVRVSELRQRVRLVEIVVAWDGLVGLDCGHSTEVTVPPATDDGGVVPPATAHCPECAADPLAGTSERKVVASTAWEPVMEQQAVGPDGDPVPGVWIEGSRVTAKVSDR